MNHKEELVDRGKELSYILRHSISEYELGWINEHGWMPVKRLIDQYHFTSELIDEIVATNNKQRYEYNEDHTKIRARQGHSIPVDVELKETTPPDVLYHGTATRFMDSILNEGLKCMSRLYVHLSDNYDLAKDEDVGNKKSVEKLARKVVDVLKSDGFQSDFSDDIDVVSPDESSFYAGAVDAFDIEMEKGIYAGMIIFNKDTFSYAFNICVPYGLYVSSIPLQINDYESVTAWIDFGYGDEDDYKAEDLEPATFYYNPEKDEWFCTDLHEPKQAMGGKWVKRIMSIVAHVVNPDSKVK